MKYFIFYILLLNIQFSFAQNNRMVITGKLVDSTTFSTVNNFSITATNYIGNQQIIPFRLFENRSFSAELINFNLKTLSINSLGFNEFKYTYIINHGNDTIKLGTVFLTKKNINLREVTIRGRKKNIELDTVKYSFKDSVFKHSVMTNEVLNLIPNLKIIDGIIYYNGKRIDNLHVNGQRFFFNDQNFTLNNLPAFSIDKIEITKADEHKGKYLNDPSSINIVLKKDAGRGILSNSLLSYDLKNKKAVDFFVGNMSNDKQYSIGFNLNNLNKINPKELDNSVDLGKNEQRNIKFLFAKKIGKLLLDANFNNKLSKNTFEQQVLRVDYLNQNTILSNYMLSNVNNLNLYEITNNLNYTINKSNSLNFSLKLSRSVTDILNDINQSENNSNLKLIQNNKNIMDKISNDLDYTFKDINNQNLIVSAAFKQDLERTKNSQIQDFKDLDRDFLNSEVKLKTEITYLLNSKNFLVLSYNHDLNSLKISTPDLNNERSYNQNFSLTSLKYNKSSDLFQIDFNLKLFNFYQKNDSAVRQQEIIFLYNGGLTYKLNNKIKIGLNFIKEAQPITLSQLSAAQYNISTVSRAENFNLIPEKNSTIEFVFEKSGKHKFTGNIGYLKQKDITNDVLSNFNNPQIIFTNTGIQRNLYSTIRHEALIFNNVTVANYFNYNISKRISSNLNISSFKNILLEYNTTVNLQKKKWSLSLNGTVSKAVRTYNLTDPNKLYNLSLLLKGSCSLWINSKISVSSNLLYNKNNGVFPSTQKIILTNFIIEQILLKNKNISCFFRGQDIFNETNVFREQILQSNFLQNSITSGIGRYFLFGITYRFNTLKDNH